eukprot:787798-Amphidinium_carterae.1
MQCRLRPELGVLPMACRMGIHGVHLNPDQWSPPVSIVPAMLQPLQVIGVQVPKLDPNTLGNSNEKPFAAGFAARRPRSFQSFMSASCMRLSADFKSRFRGWAQSRWPVEVLWRSANRDRYPARGAKAAKLVEDYLSKVRGQNQKEKDEIVRIALQLKNHFWSANGSQNLDTLQEYARGA